MSEVKDFERCSPTACGCYSKDDCSNQDYIPFGPQWERLMMRFPKKFLIDFGKRNCIENERWQAENAELRKEWKAYEERTLARMQGDQLIIHDLQLRNAELKKENERLRHRVDVLKAADDQGFEVNERLAAENTRLREALNGIDTYIESAIHNYSPVYKVIKSLINPDKK